MSVASGIRYVIKNAFASNIHIDKNVDMPEQQAYCCHTQLWVPQTVNAYVVAPSNHGSATRQGSRHGPIDDCSAGQASRVRKAALADKSPGFAGGVGQPEARLRRSFKQAVLGVIRGLVGGPIALRRFGHLLAPGFAADFGRAGDREQPKGRSAAREYPTN